MTSGRIESITPDWRGDTLAVAVVAADTVLTVTDTADFDEEDGGWLTIADDAAVEYVAVDHDASTVILAAAAGVDYEAGLPVLVWDETVPNGGAPAVEYVASVMTDNGAVPAVIPHEKVPVTGIDNVLGASATLVEDDDGDWIVHQILGREPVLDTAAIDLGVYSGRYREFNSAIPNATWTKLVFGTLSGGDDRRVDYSSGTWTATMPGVYMFVVRVQFASDSVGTRRAALYVNGTPVANENRTDSEVLPIVQLAAMEALATGDTVEVYVFQSSGGTLDVTGGANVTNARITMVGAY